jgi:hypothetical protein
MKLLIAGSREVYPDADQIDAVFDDFLFVKGDVTEVVSGGARGADDAGEGWAAINGVPVKRFPADWNRYGKGAGHRRNEQMARYADGAIVFWKDNSPGSANMIAWMTALGKPVRVVRCR